MKNNRFFSKSLFYEGCRTLRIPGFIILAFSMLVQIAKPVIGAQLHGNTDMFNINSVDAADVFAMIPFISVVFPVVAAFILFSRFNRRSFSDFYHSLPYRRSTIFVSWTLSIISWFVLISVVAGISGYLGYAAFPKAFKICFDDAPEYLLLSLSSALFFMTSALLGASLTGRVLSNLVTAGLAAFFPGFVSLLICGGVTVNSSIISTLDIPFFSPKYNIVTHCIAMLFDGYGYNEISYMTPFICTLILAAVYYTVALIVFKNRKSETASRPAVGKKTHGAIRILISSVPALLGTFFLYTFEGEIGTVPVTFYVISLITFFTYELLSSFKWKNLAKAIPSFGIVILINLVLVGITVGVKDIEKNHTVDASGIDSIRITDMRCADSNDDYSILLESVGTGTEFRSDEMKSLVSKVLSENVGYNNRENYPDKTGAWCTFIIDEGIITRTRYLVLTPDESSELKRIITESPEMLEAMENIPVEDEKYTVMFVDESYCHQTNDENVRKIFAAEYKAVGGRRVLSEMSQIKNGDELFRVIIHKNGLEYYLDGGNSEYTLSLRTDTFPKTSDAIIKHLSEGGEETGKLSFDVLCDKELLNDAYYIDYTITVVHDGEKDVYADTSYSEQAKKEIVFDDMIAKIAEKTGGESVADRNNYITLNVCIEFANPHNITNDGTLYSFAADLYMPLPVGLYE